MDEIHLAFLPTLVPSPVGSPRQYLKQEDELWKSLNGFHHQPIEGDSVRTAYLPPLWGQSYVTCQASTARAQHQGPDLVLILGLALPGLQVHGQERSHHGYACVSHTLGGPNQPLQASHPKAKLENQHCAHCCLEDTIIIIPSV